MLVSSQTTLIYNI